MVAYLLILIAPMNFFLALPNFTAPSNESWYLLFASGAILALAQWSIAKAYASADASFIQPFDLLKLPLNILAGWWVFNQLPTGHIWIGVAMLVSSTHFILHNEKKNA